MQYDAVSVEIETGEVTVMGSGKDEANAEAICNMAVIRRGVETHFYSPAVAGKYKDGDKWDGPGIAESPNAD